MSVNPEFFSSEACPVLSIEFLCSGAEEDIRAYEVRGEWERQRSEKLRDYIRHKILG